MFLKINERSFFERYFGFAKTDCAKDCCERYEIVNISGNK